MKAFYNEDAEKTVLGLFLVNQEAQKQIGRLVRDDFSSQIHQKIFEPIQALYAEGKGIDLVTVSEHMEKLYGQEANLIWDYAVKLANSIIVGSWAIESHIKIIKEAALRRRIMEIVDKAKNNLTDETNETTEVLETIRQDLRGLTVTTHKWKTMLDVLVATNQALEDRMLGKEVSMPSGISSIDRFTAGFHKGELTIIGARPSVGKSAFGAHIALMTAEQGYKVGVCSREMTDVQYGTRIVSRGTDIDTTKLRTGNLDADDWDQIIRATGAYGNLNVSFIFTTRYIEDLRTEVQSRVDSEGLDMLVVDYTQLMQAKRRFDKDYLRIGYVSKILKDMSVDYNLSVIALAQVGRASEGTMPTLAELRGSGDLEQDADNVIFLHAPDDDSDRYVRPSDRGLFAELKDKGMKYMAVNLAKQRQGETGIVNVVFDPRRMKFTAIDRERNAP